MTAIASSQGPTEVINARRTESMDAPAILDLISERTQEQFGQVNIVHLIEKSNLAVTLVNEENEILGFAAFLDYPQVEVCDPAKWEEWMREANYPIIKNCTPLNSLFMHYFVAKSDYTIGCASEIVRTVFMAVPELHFIFLVLRDNKQPEHAVSQIFEPIESSNGTDQNVLYGCYRHSHVPVLHIRKAIVEDNDDLMPIFMRLNDKLTQIYGDYFLAEMIEAQDEKNHALVAEVDGKAIGFISMSADVNTELLQEQFELTTFHGLMKPDPDDILQPDISVSEVECKLDSSSYNSNELQTQSSQDAEDAHSSNENEAPVVLDEDANDENQDEIVFKNDTAADTHTEFKPVYSGESNCFSIQLFCMDERFEMRSADFLPKVFELYPDKDFAIITTPHLVPEFPLLQHFIRATPRKSVLVTQELYLFHRAGLLADFSVRPAVANDLEQIETLVKDLEAKQDLLKDIRTFNCARRDDDGTELKAFVAECAKQVVGIAVIRREEEIEFIRSHYNIEDFIYFNHHRRDEHGHLHHFMLNPIFQHYCKHFFKEILRQGHKSCLFYPVYKDSSLSQKEHSLATGINYLVPVKARPQIIYPLKELDGNAPSERIVKKMPDYALYHINRKLTLEPKVTINARIVVVGASSVGISFLETLSFFPHLRFNNLTLVSKDGLPEEIHSASYSYTKPQLAQMSLKTWVNVVEGMMEQIDRAHKYVILKDGEKIPYDYLMLCSGQQYQVPKPTKADIAEGATNHAISPHAIDMPYLGPTPSNVFTINTIMEDKMLKKMFSDSSSVSGKFVIYGNSLEAYFMLESMLKAGVPGEKLALVLPPTSHKFSEPDTFQEPQIVKHVLTSIKEAGAEVLNRNQYHDLIIFSV